MTQAMGRTGARRGILAMVVAGFLSMACANAARAEVPAVLSEIPDDVSVAIVLPNVKATSTRISNLGTRLNLPVPPDPAGFVLRNLQIQKGFDAAGSAAIVILKTPEKKEDPAGGDQLDPPETPPLVLLLPTTDAKAILEPFQPGEPDKTGISEVTLPNSPLQTGYAVTVGKHVALAQDKDVLTRFLVKKQGLNKVVAGEVMQAFEKSDIVLYTNVPTVSKAAITAIEQQQEEMVGMLELTDAGGGGNETSAALRRASVLQLFNATKQFFRDANTGVVTIRISDAGVNLGMIGQFKEESKIGKLLLAQKGVIPPTLSGLPTGSVGAAGAMAWEGKSVAALFREAMTETLADPVVSKDPRIAELRRGVELYGESIEMIKSMKFVFLTPNPADVEKKGWINGAVVIETTDGPAYLKKMVELAKNPISTETSDPDLISKMTVTPDAATHDGVKLTKFVQTISLREETADKPVSDMAKRSYESIKSLMGPDGSVVYAGVIDNKVVCVLSADAATIDGTIAASRKNSDALATDGKIKAVEPQLVANSVGRFYLSFDKWMPVIETAIMQMFGQGRGDAPAPAGEGAGAAPAVVNPLTISVGINGSTMMVETHMPVSAITDLMAWGTRMQQKFGGGVP
jgi:hypothetical protein